MANDNPQMASPHISPLIDAPPLSSAHRSPDPAPDVPTQQLRPIVLPLFSLPAVNVQPGPFHLRLHQEITGARLLRLPRLLRNRLPYALDIISLVPDSPPPSPLVSSQIGVYIGFAIFLLGWIMQTVVIFGVPYTPSYYTSLNSAITVIFSMFPWCTLAKGVQDLSSATVSSSSPGEAQFEEAMCPVIFFPYPF